MLTVHIQIHLMCVWYVSHVWHVWHVWHAWHDYHAWDVHIAINVPEHSIELQLLHPQVSRQRGRTACHPFSWNLVWGGSRNCRCTQTCPGSAAWASPGSGSSAIPTDNQSSRKSTKRKNFCLLNNNENTYIYVKLSKIWYRHWLPTNLTSLYIFKFYCFVLQQN